MKHFLVHIEHPNYPGVYDDFEAYAESDKDRNLLMEADNKACDMEYDYLDDDEYDDEDWICNVIPFPEDDESCIGLEMLYDGRQIN